jgi:hypothetical protein
MLPHMWGWGRKRTIEDTFSARVQSVEAACLRRLAFVEAQLGRVVRPNQRWDTHMTVIDADIMPAGRITRVVEMVSDVHAWPWWFYLVMALAALAVVVGLVVVVF